MQDPQPPTDPMIGTVLGHYKIVAALGAGGMGVVFRLTDARCHRLQYALHVRDAAS